MIVSLYSKGYPFKLAFSVFLQKIILTNYLCINLKLIYCVVRRNIISSLPILVLILLLGCSKDQSVVQKSQTDQDKLVLSFLITYRSSGECLRIENSSGNTIYTCSRLDRGLCDLNLLITTSGEKIKILSDLEDILLKVPECRESATLSGILSTTQTSDSEINSLREKNSFKTIDSCSTINFSNSEKLVPSSTYVFLNSIRGKIGISAKNSINNRFLTSLIKQNAQTCINNLYTESEQILLEEIIKNEKFKEVSCTEMAGSKTCGIEL